MLRRWDRAFELIAGFLKATRSVMDRVWGNNDRYKFTTSVSLKAVSRVLGHLMDTSDTEKTMNRNTRIRANAAPCAIRLNPQACTSLSKITPLKGNIS